MRLVFSLLALSISLALPMKASAEEKVAAQPKGALAGQYNLILSHPRIERTISKVQQKYGSELVKISADSRIDQAFLGAKAYLVTLLFPGRQTSVVECSLVVLFNNKTNAPLFADASQDLELGRYCSEKESEGSPAREEEDYSDFSGPQEMTPLQNIPGRPIFTPN